MLYRLFCALVLAGLLCGCNQLLTVRTEEPAESEQAETPHEVVKPLQKDAGDAESMIFVGGTMAERSVQPNVTEQLLEDSRYVPSLSTISVKPPYPAEIWVSFKPDSREDFTTTPVGVRYTVIREIESKEAGVQRTELGGKFFVVMDKRPYHELVAEYNVLDGITEPPDTMLVYAKIEMTIYPEGTDPATIGPEHAGMPEAATATKTSNPIRVNFLRPGQDEFGIPLQLTPPAGDESAQTAVPAPDAS